MAYNTERFENRVPLEARVVKTVEVSFHLGDILPPGQNYKASDDTDLKVTMHYMDTNGRSRRKTFTLPSTDIEYTF